MAHRRLIIPILALALAACGRDEPAPVAQPVVSPEAPQAQPEGAPATEAAPPVSAAPEAATEPELPRECSELIASYERCIEDHMPEAGRDLLREALAKSREQWRQAAIDATTDATQQQLAAACRQSKTALQAQMSGYGCIL
jgi:hypothetical protein